MGFLATGGFGATASFVFYWIFLAGRSRTVGAFEQIRHISGKLAPGSFVLSPLCADLVTAPSYDRVRACPRGERWAPSRLRVGSWNIGTLTGKSIELAKILHKRKINIACVQETRADGFKLWYSERVRGKNKVGILVDKDLRELVIEVKRVNDMLMAIKIVVGGYTLNIVSAYAPHVGLDEEVKRYFWEDLDGLVWGIPSTEKLIIGGDFNGHIGMLPGGYDGVHGGFDFGDRNGGGTSLLEYAKAFELVIVNSCYPKKAEHLITFQSTVAETQIDYLLLRKCDRGLCTDCKVIPSENLTTRHMLLVMD
uniref:Craniofacial development protein 2 n=1 Tax=Nicotiana tabacum TaxID=4097 RepID=A0A1S4BE79_TOBAC|nr:PREDICTED: craniofacial development protein 2-like [Nicotiana tabacum]